MNGLVDMSSLMYKMASRAKHTPDPIHVAARNTLMYLTRPPYNVKKMICCFDGKNSKQRRRSIYPKYKGNRKDNPLKEIVVGALNLVESLIHLTAFPYVCMDELEADDVIASLVSTMKGYKVIFSDDKDLYQLVTQDVVQVDINGQEIILPHTPDEHLTVKVLNGDSSDNVSGVTGLGPVRIEKLLDEHRTLRAIMEQGEIDGHLGKMIYPKAEEVIQRNVVLMRLTNHPLLTQQDHEDVKMCVQSTWYNTWDVDALVDDFGFDRHELNTMILLGGKKR